MSFCKLYTNLFWQYTLKTKLVRLTSIAVYSKLPFPSQRYAIQTEKHFAILVVLRSTTSSSTALSISIQLDVEGLHSIFPCVEIHSHFRTVRDVSKAMKADSSTVLLWARPRRALRKIVPRSRVGFEIYKNCENHYITGTRNYCTIQSARVHMARIFNTRVQFNYLWPR